jgi:hypothetical protein
MIRKVLVLSLLLINCFQFFAQSKKARLKLDTTLNGSQLINYILNNQNIKVNNVKWRGMPSSIAKFNLDTNALGIKRGIVLTTGDVNTIPGQNKTPGTSGLAWDNNYKFKSDRDLNQLAKGRVADQVILELEKRIYNNIKINYDSSICGQNNG